MTKRRRSYAGLAVIAAAFFFGSKPSIALADLATCHSHVCDDTCPTPQIGVDECEETMIAMGCTLAGGGCDSFPEHCPGGQAHFFCYGTN